MKFEIKNRWSGELIFSIETDTWKLAVEAAIKAKANLSKADLSEANLSFIRDDVWAVLSYFAQRSRRSPPGHYRWENRWLNI